MGAPCYKPQWKGKLNICGAAVKEAAHAPLPHKIFYSTNDTVKTQYCTLQYTWKEVQKEEEGKVVHNNVILRDQDKVLPLDFDFQSSLDLKCRLLLYCSVFILAFWFRFCWDRIWPTHAKNTRWKWGSLCLQIGLKILPTARMKLFSMLHGSNSVVLTQAKLLLLWIVSSWLWVIVLKNFFNVCTFP